MASEPAILVSEMMPVEYCYDHCKFPKACLGASDMISKFLLGTRSSPKSLEDRYSRIERFFELGAHELPGLRMEAAFGAVLGHLKLSAIEIPLLLRQREPTRFIERYLQVRHYLGPKVDGASFELRSAAVRPAWRNIVRAVSFACYVLFAGVAGWLVIFGVPALLDQSQWLRAAGALALATLFACAAWLSIIEGRRISWAIQLHRTQVAG